MGLIPLIVGALAAGGFAGFASGQARVSAEKARRQTKSLEGDVDDAITRGDPDFIEFIKPQITQRLGKETYDRKLLAARAAQRAIQQGTAATEALMRGELPGQVVGGLAGQPAAPGAAAPGSVPLPLEPGTTFERLPETEVKTRAAILRPPPLTPAAPTAPQRPAEPRRAVQVPPRTTLSGVDPRTGLRVSVTGTSEAVRAENFLGRLLRPTPAGLPGLPLDQAVQAAQQEGHTVTGEMIRSLGGPRITETFRRFEAEERRPGVPLDVAQKRAWERAISFHGNLLIPEAAKPFEPFKALPQSRKNELGRGAANTFIREHSDDPAFQGPGALLQGAFDAARAQGFGLSRDAEGALGEQFFSLALITALQAGFPPLDALRLAATSVGFEHAPAQAVQIVNMLQEATSLPMTPEAAQRFTEMFGVSPQEYRRRIQLGEPLTPISEALRATREAQEREAAAQTGRETLARERASEVARQEETLTVSEAATLINPSTGRGVPFGTTRAQAAQMGVVPVTAASVTTAQALAGAFAVINEYREVSDALFTEEGFLGATKAAAVIGAARRKIGSTQMIELATRLTALQAAIPQIVRALGEKGTLATGDIERALGTVPGDFETRTSAAAKIDQLERILRSVEKGAIGTTVPRGAAPRDDGLSAEEEALLGGGGAQR